MSTAQNVYNLLLGGDKLGRWRGDQRGTLLTVGASYYGRWREWTQEDDGRVVWKQVKRKLCDKSDGRGRAIEILNENVAQASGPTACHQGIATLQQFVDVRFRPDRIESPKMKPNGRRYYEEQLKPILAALGSFRLKEFTPVMIQAFIRAQEVGRSAQTVQHRLKVLTEVFKHAKSLSFWRGDLPTDTVQVMKASDPKTPDALNEAQVSRLVASMREPERTLVLLMATCGLRIGEALALRWDNIDIDNRYLYVRVNFSNGKWTTPKTKSSYRRIPLNEECVIAIQAQRKIGPYGWLVFPNRYGRPLDAHNLSADKLKPACKLAGIAPIGWHALRHTAITLLKAKGLDGPDAKLMAGHSSERMTDVYTHAVGDRMREIVDEIRFVKVDGRVM